MLTQAMLDVLSDPAAHDSLKAAIRAFAHCDPVDAAHDASYLATLQFQRVNDPPDPVTGDRGHGS